MTDQETLLRAVAAHPDEDTPRLVYADLLDELGGAANAARARFIRTQIDLTRNPGRSWFANSDRLAEAARLAGRFADEWLDELPLWAASEGRKQRLRADDFPRGFLETYHVAPDTFAAQGEQLLDRAPIARVVVGRFPGAAAVREFFAATVLQRVRILALSGASGDAVVGSVKTSQVLGNLEELDLSGTGLTDAGARALARATGLGNLRAIAVRGRSLSVQGVSALLSAPRLPKLRVVDVRGAEVGYVWKRHLRAQFPRHTVLV
ncbi:MAG: TIGR02996 domain-containing protein [Gemmata sp.]